MNKSLTFSTINSNNNNPSNPTFYISPSINNIESFCVSQFCGVNTIYNIDNRNNNFQVEEQGGNLITSSLPVGNYTLSNFTTTLSSALSTNSTTNNYTLINNTVSNILTLTADILPIKVKNTVNHCLYESGFQESSSFNLTQVATKSYDLSGLKQIHLVSGDFGNDSCKSINSNYNTIATIPITSSYLGVINYQGSDTFINCKVPELNSITFTCLDERYRVLNDLKDFSVNIITSSV